MAAIHPDHAERVDALMRRMTIYILMMGTGVAVCGYLVIRHARRTPAAQPMQTQRGARDPREFQAIRKMESTIRIAPLGDDMTGLRLKSKLRREEERQQPQEGRN